MAEAPSITAGKDKLLLKGAFAVAGIMSTLVIYGLLQVNNQPPFFNINFILLFFFVMILFGILDA